MIFKSRTAGCGGFPDQLCPEDFFVGPTFIEVRELNGKRMGGKKNEGEGARVRVIERRMSAEDLADDRCGFDTNEFLVEPLELVGESGGIDP